MDEGITTLINDALVQLMYRENWHYNLSQAEFDDFLAWRLDTDTMLVAHATAAAAAREWGLAYAAEISARATRAAGLVPGDGATRSPVSTAIETTMSAAPAAPGPMVVPEHKGKILLVQDRPSLLTILHSRLEIAGYDVALVSNPAEATEQVGSQRVDLCLVHRVLQSGSGETLARQLRVLYPDTPIVIFSDQFHSAKLQAELEAGVNVYLVNPNDLARFRQTLERLIAKARGNSLESPHAPKK